MKLLALLPALAGVPLMFFLGQKVASGELFDPDFKAGDCLASKSYFEMPAEVRELETYYVLKVRHVLDNYYLMEQWDPRNGWYDNLRPWGIALADRTQVKVECPAGGE